MNTATQRHQLGASMEKTPAKPQTQVESMTNAVRDSLDYLSKAVEELAEKLQPVLRGEMPLPAVGKAEQPEEMLVHVADRMRDFNKRIVMIRERVQSITERTEA